MGNVIKGFSINSTPLSVMHWAPHYHNHLVSHRCHFSWEPPPPPPPPPPSSLSHPRRNPRINIIPKVTLPTPLPTLDVNPGDAPLSLPVIIRNGRSSGRASRYVWDGSGIRLVSFDEGSDGRGWSKDGAFRLARGLLVPQQVQRNYMGYLKWKLLHRVFSSALQVLATQAMFRAIGIGSARSLPSAAAFNWMLKSGLGRLSRCVYTASLGLAFDTNLKRVRFSTSILFSLSIGVELLTPAFPKHFLLLATIANVAKSISLAAYLATGSAIHRSFALADNLGEVSAKAQLQTVCFDNLGLLLAALLNIMCGNKKSLQFWLPLAVYPFFSAVDLFAIYHGLKHVHLHTLTKDRLEIIIDTWIQSGYVPSPAEVSNKEDIGFTSVEGNQLWPIRIGCINSNALLPIISRLTLQLLNDEDLYFICLEMSLRGFARRRLLGLLLCLRESAGPLDIITGLLQACRIRKSLTLVRTRWHCISEASDREGSMLSDWFKFLESSKTLLQEDSKFLLEGMQRCGWAMKSILLSSQEQARYSLIDDG